MPQLCDLCYSRDECMSAIHGYCNFLTKLYLNEADIEPPVKGWPDITSATIQMEWLHYSAIYPTRAKQGHTQDSSSSVLRFRRLAENRPASLFEVIPPHAISLTDGGRDSPIFLIDTELGIALWYECSGKIRYSSSQETVENDPYDEEDEAQAEWRGECAARSCRISLRVSWDEGNATGFYREYGRPGVGNYRKVGCLYAVEKTLEGHYHGAADR
ncbi:hypothetical protein CCMA1212_007562 [Trichoderma ghanense]|uniref:Uncharacterized protein n=1 Tax=Trichoderma ghanense TaxID=65468 RepID=A0ABY2GXY3_9HYPO